MGALPLTNWMVESRKTLISRSGFAFGCLFAAFCLFLSFRVRVFGDRVWLQVVFVNVSLCKRVFGSCLRAFGTKDFDFCFAVNLINFTRTLLSNNGHRSSANYRIGFVHHLTPSCGKDFLNF